jgi:glutamyl-tRNA reductase
MYCVYLDHTSEPLKVLGRIHQRLAQHRREEPLPGLLLHTCHRVEWYSPVEGSLPEPELARGSRLVGEWEALRRLSKIASGVMSIVVGDSLVFRQVVEADDRLSGYSSMRGLVKRATTIADEARQMFDLSPIVEYAGLPRVFKATDSQQGRPLANRLVIVGGGMLAQAIAVHSTTAYSDIVVVTRNPTRLRLTLASELPTAGRPPRVVSPRVATTEAVRVPFDLALATTSTNQTYLGDIGALARHRNVNRVIDFCAIPFLADSISRYSHISDRDVLSAIVEANGPVARRAHQAEAWIDSAARAVEVS